MKLFKYFRKPPPMDSDDRRYADEFIGFIIFPIVGIVWYFELWLFDNLYLNLVVLWLLAVGINLGMNIVLWNEEKPTAKASGKPRAKGFGRVATQLRRFDWVPSIVAGVLAGLIVWGLQNLVG